MPGEDQERFEDYLELEHYIEELQAGHVAHPPRDLTLEKANIYRMAALFRSASPEEVEPRSLSQDGRCIEPPQVRPPPKGTNQTVRPLLRQTTQALSLRFMRTS